VFSYSGLRPLPNSDGVAPGLISRDHSVPQIAPGSGRPFPILSLVGGKWTTFRGFSEEVADTVLARLGKTRRISTACLTIGGGHALPATAEARTEWIATVANESGALPARVATLLGRYGTTARAIAWHEGDDANPIRGTVDTSAREIDWILRNEQVRHLEDIVLRRTQLAITGQLSLRGLEQIADIAAAAMGWDAARKADELERCGRLLTERHHVVLKRHGAP
jgi:glycerol-3-phosphate dehydrogenase